MAIERISGGLPAPLLAQRPAVSNATELVPGRVLPLVPIGPFMAPAADAGTGRAGPGGGAEPGAAGADAASDGAAMSENQLFFSRQMVWRQPDSEALGASWRVMVHTYGEQRAALEERQLGQHLPAGLLLAEAGAPREHGAAPLAMGEDAWRFVVYGWGSQKLLLRVLASDAERQGGRRRKRDKVALRLELTLPGAGRVVVQMQPVGEGIVLELAAADPATLLQVRARLAELAEAVERAGLRLLRCHISHAPRPVWIDNNDAMRAAAAALSAPAFRAMADVAIRLTRPGDALAARETAQETARPGPPA